MKKLLLLLAAVGTIFTACEGGLDNEENGENPSTPKIELSQQSVEVAFESAQHSVSVTSPYSWEAISKNDWIVVDTPNGIAGDEKLKFTTLRNEEEQERKGTITLKNTDYNLVAELYVTQKAFVPDEIIIEPESINFTFEGGIQEVAITANFEYAYSANVDWLAIEKSESGIKVTDKGNTSFEERTAEITISSEKYGISETISVTQKGFSAESQNVMIYTSSDGKIVKPYKSGVFGANIVSNTYEYGIGIIKFNEPVTTIGEDAFSNCTSLKSITIGNSVTSIGEEAFRNCSSLISVTIGNSVTSIIWSAFEGCTSLIRVNISDLSAWCKIVFVDGEANPLSNGAKLYLNGSELTDITIPLDIIEIKAYAFSGCTSLTSITIPDSVTSIGKVAFYNCTSLTSVTIPDSVTSIGESAFYGCTGELTVNCNMPSYSSSYAHGAFSGSKFTKVTIGNSVTSIGDHAFRGCTLLTSITIPDSVTSIGVDAFYYCDSLTSVYYNGSLSAWCKISFNNGYANPLCNGAKLYLNGSKLTDITIPSDITEIKDYTFSGCTSLTSITIPNSVTSIGDKAFYKCKSLTRVDITDLSAWCKISFGDIYANPLCYAEKLYLNGSELTDITIPSDITKIKDYTFSGYTSLTSVTIPDSVTSIGGSAFQECASLTSVTIPDSVTSIGDVAFYICTSLTSVTIPDNVTSIGDSAFSRCTSLTSVYCKPTTPPKGRYDMFYDNASGRKIYVPRNSVSAYKAKQHWSDYADSIVGYDF